MSHFFSAIAAGCDGSGAADYLLDVQIVEQFLLAKKDVFWRKPGVRDPYVDTVVTLTDVASRQVAMEAKIGAVAMLSGWSGEGTEDIVAYSAEYTMRAILGHEGL
jgi:hypothetical protein